MSPSENIDNYIKQHAGWKGDLVKKIREIVLSSDPAIKEDWKWDVPVWAMKTNVCACGVFKDSVKLNFFKGASLPDPEKLFNAGLEAKKTRAIDFHEGDKINEAALKQLLLEAVKA